MNENSIFLIKKGSFCEMFKPKKFRYWQLQYELIHNFELTYQQGAVYAYLYNHCININDNGYCGYSDERIAEDLKLANSTCRREIKVLKDKGLIVVENPGKRTKKTGESRMIYINEENYLQSEKEIYREDSQMQRLQQENELLKQQLVELEKKIVKDNPSQISFLGLKLVKSGFITGEEYMKECEFYNTILQKFLEDTDFEWVQKSFRYFTNKKATSIDCYPSYLTACIKSSILHYRYQNQL